MRYRLNKKSTLLSFSLQIVEPCPHAWNVVTAATLTVTPVASSFVTAARFVVTAVMFPASPEMLRWLRP